MTEQSVSSLCNVKVVVFLPFVGVCTAVSEVQTLKLRM